MHRPFGCIFGLTFQMKERYNILFTSNESKRGERMIQLLIEPSYGANLWAQAYLAGIREEARKRGWELRLLTEDAEADGEPVLLVGSAVGWLKSHLARLAARNLPCLIAGVPPQGVRCGFAAPDYEEAAAVFAARTPERRALFAVHPSSAADEVKREAFLRQCPEGKIYENSGNLIEAAQRLARDADKLDAVLCANDVAAMTLRRLLPGGGPRLYAFGEQALPREEEISLFRMDLFACGAQAVRLCRKLEKEPDIRRCVWVPCRLEAADEPGMADTLPAEPASEFPGDFYQDPHVGEVFRFKELLAGMDSLDLDILRELLRGARYFDMTESLHTTENTIKYRIKRMTAAMGLKSRAELLKLAGEYLAEEKLTNGTAL